MNVRVNCRFNINGSDSPVWHYYGRNGNRTKKIKENYADYGSYLVINRGRQYGKTTMLQALSDYLSEEYFVFCWIFRNAGGNFAYTSEYPVLVSMLCRYMDEYLLLAF